MSERFREVAPFGADSDLRLEVRVSGESDGGNNGWAVLSGLTFLIFPSIINETWTCEATVYDRTGAQRGTIRRTGSTTTLVSLWSWLLAPFLTRGSALDRLFEGMGQSVVDAGALQNFWELPATTQPDKR